MKKLKNNKQLSFIDSKEHIVFSVFDTDNIEEIQSILLEDKHKNKYNLFFDNLDIGKDIIPKQGGAHFPKAVFFSPKQINLIVQYSNSYDGWVTLSRYLSNKLKTSFYQFELSNTEKLGKKFSFEKCVNGKTSRVVYAMQDPKWVFYEKGEVLPFENTTNYEKKRIKDRLNREIMIEYCSLLGFDIANNNFWESAKPALLYDCIGW